MKSRSLLLAAMLFAVPAFAAQAPANPNSTQSDKDAAKAAKKAQKAAEAKAAEEAAKAEADAKAKADAEANAAAKATTETTTPATPEVDKTFLQKLSAFPALLAVGYPDMVATATLGKLAAMECLKDGKLAAFLSNKWTGRVAVWGTIAGLAALAYKLSRTQDADDVDADEEAFFSATK